MTRRALLLGVLLAACLGALASARLKDDEAGMGTYSFPAPPPPPQDNRPAEGLRLDALASGGRVTVSWQGAPEGAEAVLYRSTTDLSRTRLDDVRFPIVTVPVSGVSRVDELAPEGVVVYYQLRVKGSGGGALYSPVVPVAVPEPPLPVLARPSFLVDKAHYFLEVRDGGKRVKRYPIALGRNPFKRKLHQDNASTPEGRFRIYNLQPEATFYRAYDLDYPTAVDQERYDLAAARGLLPTPAPAIGGEIQIHGQGIDANWTYGCMALRNEDMDELFAHPEIAAGTPVDIVGREITREDLPSLALQGEGLKALQEALARRGYSPGPADGRPGPATRKALGLFQLDSGLPLTCQPDRRTVERLTGP